MRFLTTPLRTRPSARASDGFLLLDLGDLVEDGLARQHDVAALLVERDDAELELAPLEDVEVLERARVGDRARQERPHADVDGQPALHALEDAALDGRVRRERLLDEVPRLAAAGLLVGKHDVAVRALRALEHRLDLLSRVRKPVGGHVVELGAGNHPFRLVADVDEDLVGRHLKHAAPDELSLLERALALGEKACELSVLRALIGHLAAVVLRVPRRHVLVLLRGS